jgi:sialic acid synthase SpsE
MKPIIISEIGINFNDDKNVLHNMIRDCAIAGADYCKVQLYNPESLFGENGEDPNEEIYEGIKGSELSKEDVKQIIKWCSEEDIGFMASVFDFQRFDWLREFGTDVYKIASRTSKLSRDLAEAIAQTNKLCYMSLGFNSEPLDSKYTNVKYLWCKSMYPTEYSEMKKMPKSFEDTIYTGISDHSLGIEASLVAFARGAQVVEKHVTYNKLGSAKSNFDHTCSITFDELADLVKYTKLMSKVM